MQAHFMKTKGKQPRFIKVWVNVSGYDLTYSFTM